MNARPINVAIVGIGRAGWGDHRKSFLARPDKFRIVAACDIIEERNQVIQEETGCRVYSCIEDLLKDEEVELVDIATRSCDHYKHARLALEAGKDVVVEKPMSIEYEEAKHLYEISNKPGMPRLFARHNRRFELVFNAFLDAINSGILGNVYEAGTGCCSFEFRDDWQTLEEFGGGLLRNWGPHLVDHCLHLLGAPVKDIYSDLKVVTAGGDAEDNIYLRLTGENNRTVTLTLTGSRALEPYRSFYAHGDRGSMTSDNFKIKMRYIDPDQVIAPVVADPGPPPMSFGKTGTFATETPIHWITKEWEVTGEDLTVFWDYVYDSYRLGKPYPIKDEEALEVIRVLSAVKNNTPITRMK